MTTKPTDAELNNADRGSLIVGLLPRQLARLEDQRRAALEAGDAQAAIAATLAKCGLAGFLDADGEPVQTRSATRP